VSCQGEAPASHPDEEEVAASGILLDRAQIGEELPDSSPNTTAPAGHGSAQENEALVPNVTILGIDTG
jgi:hypothetical protein